MRLTDKETAEMQSQQAFTLQRSISSGKFAIQSVGDYLPGNVLVTNLDNLTTEYMNKRGCDILMHTVEELAEQGPEYFQRFFVQEEAEIFVGRYLDMYKQQEAGAIYNFAHRVRPLSGKDYKWYFASAALMYEPGQQMAKRMLVVVNEVNLMGQIARKINEVLDETDWVKINFKRFLLLSKKEKEIIVLLVSGQSSAQIAEMLNISRLTVNTHRRNIASKLGTKSYASLHKFAVNFGMLKM